MATSSHVSPAGGERADYLAEVCRLLWPDPVRLSTSGAGGSAHSITDTLSASSHMEAVRRARGVDHATSEFIVLRRGREPRLFVPVGRRASAAAVRRYGEPGSLKARLATRALSMMLRSGIGAVVLRDRLRVEAPTGAPTIESYLKASLGLDLVVSMHVGAARANRKPVLQLLTPDGDTFGFAKIGVNLLTTTLVAAEREALTRLGAAGLPGVVIPRVLHYGSWQDLTVMVLSPLPVWQRRTPLRPDQLALAMGEVAGVAGISRQPLAVSSYWQALGDQLAGADDTRDRSALLEVVGDIGRLAGDAVLSFGASHGDWTPWNMASTNNGLLVWDWERFRLGVPVGFDALHHWLQSEVVSAQRDPRAAAADCVQRASSLVAPKIRARDARLTAMVYLADLATRYLVDRQAEAGALFGDPGTWLIPALTDAAAQL